ncbi:MAG TPA: FAD-binding oxidoreductase [Bellilinea sp.]|nr:FAD-binding oxidoreductase [Bellilinea sp.]
MAAIPQFDIIIIGAGSVGSPAAFSLSQAGYKVLVLDSAPSVGQTTNKRAIGGIRATHSDPAKIRTSLRSIEIFSTWKETYGDEIEWVEGGYVFVARNEKDASTLQNLLKIQKKFGLNIDWLDTKQMVKLVPDLNPEGLLGGTFSPEDGSASPLLAVHANYVQAIKHGARFLFNEHVQSIQTRAGKVIGVETQNGKYSADIVINAAGPWANEISKMVGLDSPVRPDSHEAAITEAVQHFLDPMIVDISHAEGSANYYFYQHLTGQIIFCITPRPNIWGFNTEETSSFLPMVTKRMVDLMPRLGSLRVRRTWRGLYPMTPDGAPIVGTHNEVPGYISAIGMCGQGFMLGPGIGELLQRIVSNSLTAEDEETLRYFSPYRQFEGAEKLQ